MAHAFDNHNASLSEGAPSLLWSGLYLEILIGSRLARIPRILCDKAKRGCASRVPASPSASARRTGGKKVEGATPPIFAAGAAPASVHRRTQWRTINTPLEWGRSLHSDPCGRAEMLKIWTRVVLFNLALTAAGLRA